MNLLTFFDNTMTVRRAAKNLGLSIPVTHRLMTIAKTAQQISIILGVILNVNQQMIDKGLPPLEFSPEEMGALNFLQDYVNKCMEWEAT